MAVWVVQKGAAMLGLNPAAIRIKLGPETPGRYRPADRLQPLDELDLVVGEKANPLRVRPEERVDGTLRAWNRADAILEQGPQIQHGLRAGLTDIAEPGPIGRYRDGWAVEPSGRYVRPQRQWRILRKLPPASARQVIDSEREPRSPPNPGGVRSHG